MTVRVRYAPSPTGEPHVGNIRTALFNWLFARHHGGQFILRIEDTDQDRLVPGATTAIMSALQWLGLDWDEGPGVGGPFGPYVQSERLPLYQERAQWLVEQGWAYPCYCSEERLQQLRERQRAMGIPPGYDRRCRNLSPEERRRLEKQGIRPVIRFKVPLQGETAFTDLIRGPVTWKNRLLDDFVLLKSDGWPTYHLANVVDDHAMHITHVLRAEEWLPSTPRHILLYRAFGYEPPQFAHLPMILGPDRSKLSKRHGAVSVLQFREMGYLPEAMLNYLALLGWSLDGQTELFTREDLIRYFSLERVHSAPAVFNHEKLTWMNGVYIRQLPPEDLTDRLLPFLERPEAQGGLPDGVPRPLDRDYVRRIVPLIQDRLKLLGEGAELTRFFFVDEPYEPDLLVPKGWEPARALNALEQALARVRALPEWTAPTLETALRGLAQDLGVKTGPLFTIVRVAVTCRTVAPPLFETMQVLGRETCLRRMETARERLQALAGGPA